MAENLAFLPTVNVAMDYSNTIGKYYVYGYDGTDVSIAKAESYYATYGVLYNWAAANDTTTCPMGWHLPSDAEWKTLETKVSTLNPGTKLKAARGWSTVPGTIAGTDEFGFSALPAGGFFNGSFNNVGDLGFWWTATALGSSFAWSWTLDDYAKVLVSEETKLNGFSVRCLMDDL